MLGFGASSLGGVFHDIEFASLDVVMNEANLANMRRNIAAAESELDHELPADVRRVLEPVMNQTWPSGELEDAA